MTEEDKYKLAAAIAEAIQATLRKHGYFYDSYAGINENDGYVGACNNGGCEVKFQITKPIRKDSE